MTPSPPPSGQGGCMWPFVQEGCLSLSVHSVSKRGVSPPLHQCPRRMSINAQERFSFARHQGEC